MPAYSSDDGTPTCLRCRYDLRGLPARGHCPECGDWYSHGFLEIPPGPDRWVEIERALILGAVRRLQVSWRTLAISVFVSGNAAVVVALGWMAYKRLADKCGGCFLW